MVVRLSRAQRDRIWPVVAQREMSLGLPLMNIGPYCRGCGREGQQAGGGPLPQLVIDNIDNSGDHSWLTNLQLLCRSCNNIKDPRGRVDPEPSRRENRTTLTASEQTNERAEGAFRGWVCRILADVGHPMPWGDLVDAGAEKFRVNTVTTDRYLHKLTSFIGSLREHRGLVWWRSDADIDRWKDV